MRSLQEMSLIGADLCRLAERQAQWSQDTFGLDIERGPIGALKHLAIEAGDAIKEPRCYEEYADCLLLLLDASRRAGLTVEQLVRTAMQKQRLNETRTWPKANPDEPVFHQRDEIDRFKRPDLQGDSAVESDKPLRVTVDIIDQKNGYHVIQIHKVNGDKRAKDSNKTEEIQTSLYLAIKRLVEAADPNRQNLQLIAKILGM